jgi:hypothetical protein
LTNSQLAPAASAVLEGAMGSDWHTNSNGELSATVHDLRVIIRPCAGYIRYLILRHDTRAECPEVLLRSGTESDVSRAMIAARLAAERAELVLSHRSKTGMR